MIRHFRSRILYMYLAVHAKIAGNYAKENDEAINEQDSEHLNKGHFYFFDILS